MIPLWDDSFEVDTKSKEKPKENFKFKKGETLNTLIDAARKLVEDKLGNYKDTSTCVLQDIELINFFNNTQENGIIAIDTETTGLNVLTDTLVGISVCNGKQALYIPVNHVSTISGRVKSQMDPEKVKEIFGNIFKTRKFKWVYHNAKFDLGVLRTFFGYPVPDPYWDTMLAAYLFDQEEEHSLFVWAS